MSGPEHISSILPRAFPHIREQICVACQKRETCPKSKKLDSGAVESCHDDPQVLFGKSRGAAK